MKNVSFTTWLMLFYSSIMAIFDFNKGNYWMMGVWVVILIIYSFLLKAELKLSKNENEEN